MQDSVVKRFDFDLSEFSNLDDKNSISNYCLANFILDQHLHVASLIGGCFTNLHN